MAFFPLLVRFLPVGGVAVLRLSTLPGTNVGSGGPPGTDLVVWNVAFPEHSDLLGMSLESVASSVGFTFPEHSDLLGMSPESVASSEEFTFPDASDRLGMASEGVVGPEVLVLPVACDCDSEGWAG